MNIVLYGATGRAGRAIFDELIRRHHLVSGVARDPAKLPQGSKSVVDDLSDAGRIRDVISGADAVVTAYAPPRDDTDQLVGVTDRLIAAVDQARVPRLVMVGGCGSLEFSPGLLVVDSAAWPKAYRPIARSHMKALAALKASSINWTYFSPPIQITPGERTGNFRLGEDVLIRDDSGKSQVSFEDYADALVDELERPAHERSRFTIGY